MLSRICGQLRKTLLTVRSSHSSRIQFLYSRKANSLLGHSEWASNQIANDQSQAQGWNNDGEAQNWNDNGGAQDFKNGGNDSFNNGFNHDGFGGNGGNNFEEGQDAYGGGDNACRRCGQGELCLW